jgi:uncharacterized Fe-S cluster protein YjdI
VTLYDHLPRRTCTAAEPMPHEDRNHYFWTHPDAKEVEPFFNLVIYWCPNCALNFHAPKRSH